MRPLLVVIPPDNPPRQVACFMETLDSLLKGTAWSPQVVHLDLEINHSTSWPWQHDGLLPRAVIWYYARPQDLAMIESLASSGATVVTYNRDLRFLGASAVVADVEAVVRTQFEWLWEMDKRRFALLSTDRPSPSIQQYGKVARDLAVQHGAGDDFRWVSLPYTATQRPSDEMIQRIEALMAGVPRPDAVMCADIFSFRGLELWLARNRHVHVPQDLGIATFDSITCINVQRLKRQILAGRIDQPRMLAHAIRLIEDSLAHKPVNPQIVRIPAVMDDAPHIVSSRAPIQAYLSAPAEHPSSMLPVH